MKIVYLHSGRLPTEKAHGYQIMKMCEAFVSLGHEVLLLTAHRETLPGENDPFQYYGIKNNFSIRRVPVINLVNVVPKFGSWLLQIGFLIIAKIYLVFHRYDLLYLREHMSGLFFRDFILEVHSLPAEIRSRDLRVWRRAKKIVTLTSFVKNSLAEAGVPGDKVMVAADAVDLATFDTEMAKAEARQRLGLPTDKKIIGYTGSFRTLQMDKGISAILKALPQIPDAIFVAVGGSRPDIDHYQKEAAANGVAERVLLLPRADLDKLAVYQKAFDVLMMPFPRTKHYEYYMSPLKMFEYMAAKRPIVASDLPSVREVLNDDNAIIVEPDNAAALAEGVLRVLRDEDLAKRISQQAFADVKLFTWKNRAKMILS